MKTKKKTVIYLIFLLIVIIFAKIPEGNAQTLSDSEILETLIPEDLIMQDTYQPAFGNQIGKIQLIHGKAIIIHSDDKNGYSARQDLPVFEKDTVITMEKSRLRFEMIDGSVMTMASNSKMKLSKTIFDKETKIRTSFINMALGKVRFIVQKLKDFNESKFTIKTKTAVVGVRGSDFIVKTTDNITEVTTLDDTVLEIISLKNLESPPVLLQDFEHIQIESGFLPSEVISVSPETIQDMIMEMSVVPESIEPGKMTDIRREKVEKHEAGMQPPNSGLTGNEDKQPGVESKGLNSNQKVDKPASPQPVRKPDSKSPPPSPESGAEPEPLPPPEQPEPGPPMPVKLDNAISNSMPMPEEIKISIEPDNIIIPGNLNEDDMARQEDLIRQENERIIEKTVEDINRLPDLPKPPY